MKRASSPGIAALLAVAVVAALGFAAGWLVLLSGGFHHAPHRYTSQTTFVSGVPAWVMAAIFFALAAAGVAAVLQALAKARVWYIVSLVVLLLPPFLYALRASPALK